MARRKPKTKEEQEAMMVGLAMELAEKQLRDGTAKSNVIVHYLKLGECAYQTRIEKLERENEFLKAKTEREMAQARVDEIYKEALTYLRKYSGDDDDEVVG